MDEVKEYGLDDILTITTSILLSSRHMDGVYDILGYMTGEELFTHQLPRAAEQCRPELLRQHPQLADVTIAEDANLGEEGAKKFVAEQVKLFGEKLPVRPLATHAGPHVSPIEELADMVGPERIIVIPAEPQED